MPTQWTTFPVEFKGGLISNQSPLQQGINSIGSTTILQNMEPDRQGGYTKIKGYQKFSSTEIPGTGNIQGLKVVSNGRAVVARKIDQAAIDATAALSSGDLNKTGYYFGTGTAWTHMATSPLTGGGKVRKATFNFDGDDKTIFVDGTNYPVVYNSSGNTMSFMSSSTQHISTDLEGAELITVFDNSVVYSKNNNIYVSGQFTEANITGGGAVNIVANVGNTVTGLAVFREKLIIFTEDKIQSLVRTDASPFFKIEPVTDKIGCISSDSIQEFGGDIMYLAPDGLRLLSATDRIGDFALDVTSDRIFKDADDFLRSTPNYCSIIIREKAQYRIFAYVGSQSTDTSEGLIATKFIPQGGSGVEWSTTKGIKAFVADSIYSGTSEAIMFANEDGYLYEMEQTNGFDGSNIETIMETPYMPITDPEVRKTAYKLTLYTDPTGQMDLKFRLLFDFDSGGDTSIIQPEEIDIGSTTGGSGVFIFGQPNSIYGGTGVLYGSKLKRVYNENLIGSFHTVAMRITSDSTNPPFTLDSAILQYRQNDRQ